MRNINRSIAPAGAAACTPGCDCMKSSITSAPLPPRAAYAKHDAHYAILCSMIRRFTAGVLALFLAAIPAFAADLAAQYRTTADELIDAALTDTEGYDRLA